MQIIFLFIVNKKTKCLILVFGLDAWQAALSFETFTFDMDHWTVCVLKQAYGLWVTILQEIAPVDFKATPTTSAHTIIF